MTWRSCWRCSTSAQTTGEPLGLKRTYELDVLKCECGGERRVIAFITEPGTERAILVSR